MKSTYDQLRPLGLLAEISIIYFLLPILAAVKLLPLSPMIMLVIVMIYCLIREIPGMKSNIELNNISEYIKAGKRILAINHNRNNRTHHFWASSFCLRSWREVLFLKRVYLESLPC